MGASTLEPVELATAGSSSAPFSILPAILRAPAVQPFATNVPTVLPAPAVRPSGLRDSIRDQRSGHPLIMPSVRSGSCAFAASTERVLLISRQGGMQCQTDTGWISKTSENA